MIYKGYWKNDKKNRIGEYTWPNGQKYTGDFVDDQFEGYGETTLVDGTIYKGYWKNDKRNGKVVYTWPDGQKYVGDFIDDQH